MARRGARIIGDVAEGFLRIGVATLLDASALILWNVGTRPPHALFADLRAAIVRPRALLFGLVRFVVGLGLVIAAGAILLPALPDPTGEFVPLEIFTFVAALICEVLVGNEVRRLLNPRPEQL